MTSPKRRVKIKFLLEHDEEGYPPVDVESVWAQEVTDENLFAIDNSPFYVYDVSWKDIVSVEEKMGEIWYKSVVKPSDHSTVRIFFFRECSVEKKDELLQKLKDDGCSYEGFKMDFPLFSVDMPPGVNYVQVLAYLRDGEEKGLWGVEEAAVRHTQNVK